MPNARRNRSTAIQKQHRHLIAAAEACAICGKPLDKTLPTYDPGSPVVDHITPIARGGSDDVSNKQVTHRACNAAKGTRPWAPIIKRSGAIQR